MKIVSRIFRYFSQVAEKPLIDLRPYQLECIETTISEFSKGCQRQAVSLPVGSGKTVIFANLIKRLPKPHEKATKSLVLAHREELLQQARNQITRFAPELTVSIEQGNSVADPASDVIIASVPTLGRMLSGAARLQKFDPSEFKCIIIDEAHHSVTDTYIRIMEHFGVLDGKHPHILVWGCSATLSRFDELALGNLYEKVTFHKDIRSLIEDGWLCPFQTYQIITSTDLSKVKKSSDFDTVALSLAINTPIRNELVASTWKQVAYEQHGRKSTIVFALNIAHVNGLVEAFKQVGVEAVSITSLTEDEDREDILLKFKNGQIPVLINCAVLTEGTDLPRTDCILMTRPTCNSNLYIQMVGRGLRRHPEKEYCLVLDVVDKLKSGERTLVTFPNLLAHKELSGERDEVPTDEESFIVRDSNVAEIKPENVNISIRYFNPIAFRPSTTLAWITISNNQFLLSSKTTNYLLTIQDGIGVSCSIQQYSNDHNLVDTIYEEQPTKEVLPQFYTLLKDRNQYYEFLSFSPWRRKFPPSENQIKLLARIMSQIPGSSKYQFQEMYQWSVGRAASIISKYMFMTRRLKVWPSSWDDLVNGIKNY